MSTTKILTELEKVLMDLQTRKTELEEKYANTESEMAKEIYVNKREAVLLMLHAVRLLKADFNDAAPVSATFVKAMGEAPDESKHWITQILKALTIQ